MTLVEKIEDDGYTIEIHYDDSPESPREWDNVGVLAQLSSDYSQPDAPGCKIAWCTRTHSDIADALIEAWDRYDRDAVKVERYARAFLGAAAVDWWDDPQSGSRIVGVITREAAQREQLTDPLATLNAELQTYAAWAEGAVFGYVVTSPDGEHLDSCWGYYGWDEIKPGGYVMECAQGAIDFYKEQKHAERVAMFRKMVAG
jgi:hypothetical protein